MDQLVQCPVCTLFLHNGMSLESHLDTHPKDQVIKALCTIANKSPGSSRTSTPAISERSYRSRSRTPASEDVGRWNNNHRSSEHDRYWPKSHSGTSSRAASVTPSRTPSRTAKFNNSVSRNCTPDINSKMVDNLVFENSMASGSSQHSPRSHSSMSTPQLSVRADKTQQTYPFSSGSDFEQNSIFYPEQQEDREIKYSRTAEYNAMDVNNTYNYNLPPLPTINATVKVQEPSLLSHTPPKKRNDPVKIMPKPNNNNMVNLVKNNISGMTYLTPGTKPVHVMIPSTPTFVQKNVQNSMIVTGALPGTQVQMDAKTVSPIVQNRFNQITSGTFTPGTTVVTQNSQYFYQEMVQNIDPKSFIPSIPALQFTGHENVTNVAQTSSMYQNLMIVDAFGNPSCMYATPQQVVSKPCAPQLFQEPGVIVQQKSAPAFKDSTKTLIIEVGPIVVPPPAPVASASTSSSNNVISRLPPALPPKFAVPKQEVPCAPPAVEKVENISEAPGMTPKGLKILSNIKVEVPVQHNKNMINTVMDLTGSGDTDYLDRAHSPGRILPDLDSCKLVMLDRSQPSTSRADGARSFAGLKKITNTGPTSSKGSASSKPSNLDNKVDMEGSDSCPVPDLICNEKPSISPCSELSESGDSADRASVSPRPENKPTSVSVDSQLKIQLPVKPFRNNPLRLNNIYVKKNKKVLQIKNLRVNTSGGVIRQTSDPAPGPSAAPPPLAPLALVKEQPPDSEMVTASILKTISIEVIKDKDEPVEFEGSAEEGGAREPQRPKVETVTVKEELSTGTEGGFSDMSEHGGVCPPDPLRPVSVAEYGGPASPPPFDEESGHRELLDLEGATKTKQFVSMMNDNYFGDNIYADYFTPDRGEAFDERGPTAFKESGKEPFSCSLWGEPSVKESEFVLPNFIHESYKIADSGMEYAEGAGGAGGAGDADGERECKADLLSESRSDGEPTLNICADERMPPRGELSGQESNGDMDSSWNGMYSEVTPAEPYDLMARESWVSDGSECDGNERRDNLEEDLHFPKVRLYTCSLCGGKLPSLKELRLHKSTVHSVPSSSKTSYSRMVTARIKKEEKLDEGISCGANLLALDSKDTITSTILQVYETMGESKPLAGLQGLIKQETKRRKRDFVCPTCKVDQLTDAAFNAHLKIHPLECLTCGKCFYRRANLALHIKTHLGIKNYKCEICEKRFITRQKLMEHHNIHTGRAPVKCTHCDDTFRRYSNMLQHRDRHHFNKRAKVRDFVCPCGQVFHSRAKFLWHREIHDDKPKACLYCSDKFVHAASLARHVRRSHNHHYMASIANSANAVNPAAAPAKPDNVPCPICKKVYLRRSLRGHLATHAGKREFSCVVCNKAFTTKWNLKLHRWTHAGRSAKPHKCPQCPAAFVRADELAAHSAAHRQAKHYTCNVCGCRFLRKYNCQRHAREHDQEKRYTCTVPDCGKAFHRSYYLAEHMKVHSGARPFACNVCGKTSSNKSNHNKHVKIHHAREPVASEA